MSTWKIVFFCWVHAQVWKERIEHEEGEGISEVSFSATDLILATDRMVTTW
jgi:hypothetical protein